jgi:class 3 adenylate cyclase
LINKPEMTDERSRAIVQILDNLSPSTYLSGSTNLWVLHVLYKINLTIEMGLTPQGGYAFSELGLFFFIIGNYDFAYPSAEMAMRITEKFRDSSPRHLSRAGHIVTNYNAPWVKHVSETIRPNNEAYRISLDSGELIFAGYTSLYPHLTAFYLGKESAGTLIDRLPESLKFTRAIHHDLAYYSLQSLSMVLHTLTGRSGSIVEFATPHQTEDELSDQLQRVNTPYAMMVFQVYKAYAYVLLGDWNRAYAHIKATEPLIPVMTGAVVLQTLFTYLKALVHLGLVKIGNMDKEEATTIVEADLALLRTWASHNPANFEHKALFVEAELCVMREEVARAVELYEEAIESAVRHEYLRESALIHEHAAQYWLSRGVKLYAQAHADSAHTRYASLGYSLVVERIEREFADVLRVMETGGKKHRHSTTIVTTTDMTMKSLDSSSLMKAARAITESIELDALIDRLLHIVLENAGAQRVVLITQESGVWTVNAEVDINSGREVMVHNHRLESSVVVPVSIINYVIRTGADALSTNEATRKLIERDPYYDSYKPVSYFSLPLSHKGESSAILYAETRQGSDFVTSDRVDVIRLLSSQMAIALENALLYNKQSELTEAAQRFVPLDFIKSLGRSDLRHAKLGDAINEEMTVMFGDIRSYSAIAESLSVEETFDFINRYLSSIGPEIRNHNGFINHYHGDGFIALFRRDPSDALNAANGILRALDEFNRQQIARRSTPIRIGIGLHTGRVMMGIIGDGERLDANVISDAVNTASRLEGMTKILGTTVVLSESTLAKLKDVSPFDIRFLGKVNMVGKEEVLSVYELFNADHSPLREQKQRTFTKYNDAVNSYYAREFTKAAKLFEEIVAETPSDAAAERFLSSARSYIAEPPDADWQGVEVMTVK